MTRKAVVLLSGGLDSTTVLAIAKDQGFEAYALSFRYGQRHEIELAAAQRVAEAAGVQRHIVCDIDLRVFGGSALTADVEVPKHDSAAEISDDEIPITYVPARNTVFLSFALAYAEVVGSHRHLHRRQRTRLLRLPGLPSGVHCCLREHGESGYASGCGGSQTEDPHPAHRPHQGADGRDRNPTWRRLLADVVLL